VPAFIHETAVVDEDVALGDGSEVWHFAHVCARARIGARCVLGQNVYVGPGVRIGAGVRVQNNVSVYEGVEIEDDVFLGPSCAFTNVSRPRAAFPRKGQFEATRVRRGATVGANATVVCPVELGAHCMIGAGAVVTRDVPAYALVVGAPARRVGWVCACGERLPDGAEPGCAASGRGDWIEAETCRERA
jgi:UDP-2-acetamido-3-amino-2,3-dideoxy-glucuronate N-acetyltransferase